MDVGICRVTKPIDLGVVGTYVEMKMMAIHTNCNRSAVYRRNRIGPRTESCELQIGPLMALSWSSLIIHIVCGWINKKRTS